MTKTTIPIDAKSLSAFNMYHGASIVLDKLKGIPETSKFLGFSLALATAERETADLGAQFRIHVMRAASKEGLPVHAIKTMAVSKNEKFLEVEIEEQGDLLESP